MADERVGDLQGAAGDRAGRCRSPRRSPCSASRSWRSARPTTSGRASPMRPLTDLGDGVIVPGFIDAHMHPSIVAEDLLNLDVSSTAVRSLRRADAQGARPGGRDAARHLDSGHPLRRRQDGRGPGADPLGPGRGRPGSPGPDRPGGRPLGRGQLEGAGAWRPRRHVRGACRAASTAATAPAG